MEVWKWKEEEVEEESEETDEKWIVFETLHELDILFGSLSTYGLYVKQEEIIYFQDGTSFSFWIYTDKWVHQNMVLIFLLFVFEKLVEEKELTEVRFCKSIFIR